jgi:hypothetical protein
MKQPSLMVCTTLVFACPVLGRNLFFLGADPSGLVSPDGRMWICTTTDEGAGPLTCAGLSQECEKTPVGIACQRRNWNAYSHLFLSTSVFVRHMKRENDSKVSKG